MSCATCQTPFLKRQGGYKRHYTSSLARDSGIPVGDAINDLLGECVNLQDKSFVCGDCFKIISKAINEKAQADTSLDDFLTRAKGLKRERVFTPTKIETLSKKRHLSGERSNNNGTSKNRKTSKTKAIEAVKRSRYLTAFRHITASRKGSEDFRAFLMKLIRKEVNALCFKTKLDAFPMDVTMDSIKSFSWQSILGELGALMPTLVSACTAALTSKKAESHLSR